MSAVDETLTAPVWRVVSRPRPTAARGEAYYELTPIELRVLQLLPRGLTRARMGAELTVSEDTVKTHLSKVASRWRVVGGPRALLAHAYRLGVVPLPDGPELAALRHVVADMSALLGLEYVPGQAPPPALVAMLRTRLAGVTR